MYALCAHIRCTIFSCSTLSHFFSIALITEMISADGIASALSMCARDDLSMMGGSDSHALKR